MYEFYLQQITCIITFTKVKDLNACSTIGVNFMLAKKPHNSDTIAKLTEIAIEQRLALKW